MKKVNYRVISALFSFLFAFVCVTITTFAWFIIGDEAAVDNLEFAVHGEDNIEIGVKIEDEDIANEFGVEVGDIYYPESGDMTSETLKKLGLIQDENFHPVSSAYQSEWMNAEDAKPVLREVPKSDRTIKGDVIASNGYYQFEFYFKATENMYLYLDETTTVLPDVEKNTNMASNPEDIKKLNKVAETLRISFYNDSKYRIFEPNVDESSKTKLFGKLDIIDTDGYYDYYIKDQKEILFGECDRTKAVYGDPWEEVYDDVTYVNCFDAKTLKGVQPLDIEASIENGIQGAIQETETLKEMSTKDDSNDKAIAFLERRVDTKIVITVWSEGWDLDCTMDIINASFLINLVFSGNYAK